MLPFRNHLRNRCGASLLLVAVCCCAMTSASGQVLTIPQYSDPAPFAPTETYSTEPLYFEAPVVQPQTPFDTPAADFVVAISTDLLCPFVNRQNVQSRDVAMRVMEADVRGVQTTVTNVRLQSSASSSMARLDIVSNGQVSSSTSGFTPQARIDSAGQHSFRVIKPIFFDGHRFLTKPAYGTVHAQQTPQAVRTVASGVPLLGRIGERIAWNEVYRRMPVSDAIVVRKVADDVLPQINRPIDQELTRLNDQWKSLHRRLNSWLAGDSLNWNATSTDSAVTTSVTNRSVTQRTHGLPRSLQPELTDGEAVAVLFSQDGLNHALDKLPVGGLTISDTAFQQLMPRLKRLRDDPESFLDLLNDRNALSAAPTMFSIQLAESRPFEVHFDDGVTIVLRFRVLPRLGNPGQLLAMELHFTGESTAEGAWAVTLADVTAAPAKDGARPGTWSELINTQAGQLISTLPPVELPRQIDLSQFQQQLPVLRLHRIQTDSGYMRIALKLDRLGTCPADDPVEHTAIRFQR